MQKINCARLTVSKWPSAGKNYIAPQQKLL